MKTKNLLPTIRAENDITSFFDNIWEPVFKTEDRIPKIDIEETEKEIIVSAEMPGVDKKDIKVDLNDDRITISFEKKENRDEKKGKTYRLIEQSYGKFTRSFTLPAPVKSENAKAEYKNGILKLTLLKQKETKIHQIKIDWKRKEVNYERLN